jgi:hypothetical protein
VQKLRVYLVHNTVILRKLPRKWSATLDHFVEVPHGEDMRILLRRIIPSDVVHVVANCSTPKLLGVADNCLEIAFW